VPSSASRTTPFTVMTIVVMASRFLDAWSIV
jgi:hypothetical protein